MLQLLGIFLILEHILGGAIQVHWYPATSPAGMVWLLYVMWTSWWSWCRNWKYYEFNVTKDWKRLTWSVTIKLYVIKQLFTRTLRKCTHWKNDAWDNANYWKWISPFCVCPFLGWCSCSHTHNIWLFIPHFLQAGYVFQWTCYSCHDFFEILDSEGTCTCIIFNFKYLKKPDQ